MTAGNEGHESRLAHLLATALNIEPMLFEEVVQVASKDELTGAYKESFFQSFLENELKRAHVLRYPLGLLTLEIEVDPKPENEHRTMAEDQLLKSVAEVVSRGLRITDWIARVDDDELAIVLPGCPLNRVIQIAEDARSRIDVLREVDYTGQEIRARLYVSGAVFSHGFPRIEAFLSVAEEAGEQAREKGPGSVVIRTMSPWQHSRSAA